MAKKFLDESKATELFEESVYLEAPEDVVSEEQIKIAISSLISDMIKDEFALIEKITSAIATVEYENIKEKEDIKTILQTLLDEKNMHIGMLTGILEILDPKTSDLMTAGIEKAQEIISEPASTDLN